MDGPLGGAPAKLAIAVSYVRFARSGAFSGFSKGSRLRESRNMSAGNASFCAKARFAAKTTITAAAKITNRFISRPPRRDPAYRVDRPVWAMQCLVVPSKRLGQP